MANRVKEQREDHELDSPVTSNPLLLKRSRRIRRIIIGNLLALHSFHLCLLLRGTAIILLLLIVSFAFLLRGLLLLLSICRMCNVSNDRFQ